MNLNELEKEFLDQRLPVKLDNWGGYWRFEDNTIMMYCKDGSKIKITDTPDVMYTMRNVLSDRWEVATKENCPILKDSNLTITLNFEEALRHLKSGIKVCRASWEKENTKVLYLVMIDNKLFCGIDDNDRIIEIPYTLTNNDIFQNDWKLYKEE